MTIELKPWERRTVNISQAAAITKMSRRTIYNWIRAGKVETVKMANGGLRIYLDTLYRNTDGTPLPYAVQLCCEVCGVPTESPHVRCPEHRHE